MGNTLIKSRQDFNFDENNLVAQRVKKILTERTEVLGLDENGKEIKGPINKYRACCMGVLKEEPNNNEFISVKLPYAVDESNYICKKTGYCLPSQNLALRIKGDPEDCRKGNLYPGKGGVCDSLMTNYCAKDLYSRGCIKCKEGTGEGQDKECVPIWDSSNKNCFNPNPNNPYLQYGPADCACINSSTGFTLNNNPSNSIYGGFKERQSNPYDVRLGQKSNLFTKYSANVFGYASTVQNPLVLDSNCSALNQDSTSMSGISRPYLLSGYKNDPKLCLNQINIGNSNINSLNFKNIQQKNNCGGVDANKLRENLDSKEKKAKEEKIAQEEKKAKEEKIAQEERKARKVKKAKEEKIAQEESEAKKLIDQSDSEDTVSKEPTSSTDSEDTVSKEPTSSTDSDEEPTEKSSTKESKSSSTGLIIGGVVMAVLIIIVIIYFMNKNKILD